jgi:hypothetical protein
VFCPSFAFLVVASQLTIHHALCLRRYYHELFLRSRPDLSRGMIRTRVKGTAVKAASSPDSEPDFYQMEYCGDPSDSFFDCHCGSSLPPTTNKPTSAESPTQDENGTKKHLESRLVTSRRDHFVHQPNRHHSGRLTSTKDSPTSIDTREAASTSPAEIDRKSSIEFTAPAFIEDIKLNCFGAEDTSDKSDCSSIANWIQSCFSSEVVDSTSESALNAEHDHVPSVPVASVSMDESDISLGKLDLATSCNAQTSDEPHTGDTWFFEGKPFRYMDHIQFDSLPALMSNTTIIQPDDDNVSIGSLDPSTMGDGCGDEEIVPSSSADDCCFDQTMRYIG